MSAVEINHQDGLMHRLESIYQDVDNATLGALVDRVLARLEGATSFPGKASVSRWDESSCLLITYADSITDGRKSPLACLDEFVETHLDDVVDCVHILPFFPSTGDDGFSVMDYRAVDPRLGSWGDLTNMSASLKIMADVILNHGSRSSAWFRQFVDGETPGSGYFLSVDEDFDISNVIRPREHALLQPVTTAGGERRVWCTFSEDQVDFDFSNPLLLEEFIGIILDFIDHGIRILRLDAVGFLWKETGTTCLNLRQTHAIIQLVRYIADIYDEETVIVTETNLPNQENLSYFGNGNEAHWIYNFSLPPLILYSLLFADSSILRRWSMSMPPALMGTSYLNFLSSHDGFGMRPTEGLLDEAQRQRLLDRLEANGSLFSRRAKADGTTSVYEANTTLFSALEKTDDDPAGALSSARFVAAYALMFGLEGIPAIYINSLISAQNDTDGVAQSGMKRRINRQKFAKDWLDDRLSEPASRESFGLVKLKELLTIRKQQPAFHPNATQFTLQLRSELFGVWRQSQDRKQSIFAITNLCASEQGLDLSAINLIDTENWHDLVTQQPIEDNEKYLKMSPYQTVWITNQAAPSRR
jgi:sucrose phosphorylase